MDMENKFKHFFVKNFSVQWYRKGYKILVKRKNIVKA